MNFFFEYIKHPRKIGAVAPSGKRLAEKMMKPICFDSAKVIVEYGPGTGAFTRELIIRRRPDTVVILIEQNERFCGELRKLFRNQPNLYIICGSAENVNEYLGRYGFEHADYVISGLPFSSLPTDVSDRVLTATKKAIENSGVFATFQYTMMKKRMFEHHFRIVSCIREMKNLPPAYVLEMKNVLENSYGK